MWIRIRVKRNLLDQDPEGKIVENAQKSAENMRKELKNYTVQYIN